MAEQQLPVWNSKGVEPPANLQRDGWQPGVKPPAQYFDWLFNRAYECLEELQVITEELELNKANGTELTTLNNKVTQHLDDIKINYYSLIEHTAIKNNADLNTILDFGNYVSYNANVTNTLLNCPVTDAGFVLKVERITGGLVGYARRTIKANTLSSPTYEQNIVNGSLGPWRRIADEDDLRQKTDKKNIIAGGISIIPTAANTPTSKIVPWSLTGVPVINATANTASPGSVRVSYTTKSANGCTIWLDRPNVVETFIDYTAILN